MPSAPGNGDSLPLVLVLYRFPLPHQPLPFRHTENQHQRPVLRMTLPGEAKVLLQHPQRQSILAPFNCIMYQASTADPFLQSSTASPESSIQPGVKAK